MSIIELSQGNRNSLTGQFQSLVGLWLIYPEHQLNGLAVLGCEVSEAWDK